MSLAAKAQRIRFDKISLFQPSEAKTVRTTSAVGRPKKRVDGRKPKVGSDQKYGGGRTGYSPHIPGSSKHESWLETVMRGTWSGRSIALSKETRLYTFTLLNHSENDEKSQTFYTETGTYYRVPDGERHLLMNILLKIPTAANVMQEATVHRARRFLSLGSTQSMLYSFFAAISSATTLRDERNASVTYACRGRTDCQTEKQKKTKKIPNPLAVDR